MASNFITEIRNFVGGMIKDLFRNDIPRNKYVDAENTSLTPNEESTLGGISSSKGTAFAFQEAEINFATDADDYKAYRLAIDPRQPLTTHTITISGIGTFILSSSAVNFTLRYLDLVSQLEAATTSISGSVYIPNVPLVSDIVYVGFRGFGVDFTLTETIVGAPDIQVNVIKEFYGVASNGIFDILKSFNIGDNLYLIETNGKVIRLSVAVKNEITGAWTYTRLLQTKQIVMSQSAIIDLDGEIDFGFRVSLYFTGKGYIPRVFYVKLIDPWIQDYSFIYNENPAFIAAGNPDGYFTYENIDENSKLQVLKNFARVTNAIVNNIGGNLTTGGKSYLIRQLIGDDISSGFNLLSNPTPIFSDSLSDTRLSGDNGGEQSSKSITLTIDGLSPENYDKFELICADNVNGVFSFSIIGKYTITSETQTITHYGTEATSSISLDEILTQQIVVKDAANLVINRNRLFLSDISVTLDPDLSEWAKTITFNIVREELDAIGTLYSTVNEYQKPENTFLNTGYMLNETYRLGPKVFMKSGFITQSYFSADVTITDANGYLTNSDQSKIYIYNIQANINTLLAPAINGIPFEEAVYAISIMRQECVPEVLAAGYWMAQTSEWTDTDTFKHYSVGRSWGQQEPGQDSSNFGLKRGAFLSPDVLFGTANITVQSNNTLRIYGEPDFYNKINIFTLNKPIINALIESNGFFQDRVNIPYKDYTLQEGELVQFDSLSNLQFSNGIDVAKYDTGVSQNNELGRGGNQQKSIGISSNSEMINSHLLTYQAFEYAQLIRFLTNKYGDEKIGFYKDCGNFIVLNGTGSYSEIIRGGDTFTEKNFTKFINRTTSRWANIAVFTNHAAHNSFPVGGYVYRVFAVYGVPVDDKITAGAGYNVVTSPFDNTNLSVLVSWISIPYFISSGGHYELYRFFGGDWLLLYSGTATSFEDFNDSYPPATVDENFSDFFTVRAGLSYYTQNRGNYQLRYFTSNSLDYPYTTIDLQQWLDIDPLNPGQLLYSYSYSPINNFFLTSAYNRDLKVVPEKSSTLYYSELKIEDSLQDAYRIFLPLNNKPYPAIYGSINNTFRDGNRLIILMDNGVLIQELNQQQQETDGTGVTIILGDGTVLGARETVLSQVGAPVKTGALQYLTNAGKMFVAWLNPKYKKLLKYSHQGLFDIGEEQGLQAFLTQNNQFVSAERSIIMGYNFFSNELIIETKTDVPDSVAYSPDLPYNKGQIVYMDGSYVAKRYFKAQINVPEGKDPTLPANQLQYWAPYRNSNYNLVFNEKLNAFSHFYTFVARIYMVYKNTMLSKSANDGLISKVYEHNMDTTVLYEDNLFSYVSMVFNSDAKLFKTARDLFSEMNFKPLYIHFKGINGTKTFSDPSTILQKRQYFWTNTKNDATITSSNPNGLGTLHTQRTGGENIEVTVYFNNEEGVNTINTLVLNMIPKPRLFNT